MKIACAGNAAAQAVLDVIHRHGIIHGISWQGGSPVDERICVVVSAVIDPTVDAAIRRDIASIAGAAIQE